MDDPILQRIQAAQAVAIQRQAMRVQVAAGVLVALVQGSVAAMTDTGALDPIDAPALAHQAVRLADALLVELSRPPAAP